MKKMDLHNDNWVEFEELPVRSNLKVIRENDPDYGFTADEIQDRYEFIRCYLLKEYELILMIPKQEKQCDFFVVDFLESAFNTYDYQGMVSLFNSYGYASRKVLDSVKDLAIMHSALSSEEGRSNVKRRYEQILEREFFDKVMILAKRFKDTGDSERRLAIKKKIAVLNIRVIECKGVWEQFASPGCMSHSSLALLISQKRRLRTRI